MKFNMLINVITPEIFGVLTFSSIINTKLDSLRQEKSLFFSILVYGAVGNFMLYSVEHE